jgi:hypothetical protein
MTIRAAALSTLVALASGGTVLAEVVKGPDLVATGRIVSTGNTSLVLQTSDHGHSIPFVVGTTSHVPPGLAPGSEVTVHYHPVGTDRQMADGVLLVEPRVASAALGQATSGAQATARPQPPPASSAPAPAPAQDPMPASSPATPRKSESTDLPRTASPIALVGLLGLAAFLGSALVRQLERGL